MDTSRLTDHNTIPDLCQRGFKFPITGLISSFLNLFHSLLWFRLVVSSRKYFHQISKDARTRSHLERQKNIWVCVLQDWRRQIVSPHPPHLFFMLSIFENFDSAFYSFWEGNWCYLKILFRGSFHHQHNSPNSSRGIR